MILLLDLLEEMAIQWHGTSYSQGLGSFKHFDFIPNCLTSHSFKSPDLPLDFLKFIYDGPEPPSPKPPTCSPLLALPNGWITV